MVGRWSVLLLLFLVACAPQEGVVILPDGSVRPSEFTVCEGVRPEICTEQYVPVCASSDTGIRCIAAPCPSVEWKTYSNSCFACADKSVYGYVQGACTAGQESLGTNVSSWPSCSRPNHCLFSCAYVTRDWEGNPVQWPGVVDENGLPAESRRCITPEYAEFMVQYGLVTVDKFTRATIAVE